MASYPEIIVLRHGQTQWNKLGRHQGRLDSPLTELGKQQAAEQGKLLQQVVPNTADWTCYYSPQGRAERTARIALSVTPWQAQPDPRLREVSFGKWQGLTFDQIAHGWPEHCKYADKDMFAWNFQAPGGETFADVSTRAQSFLDDLTGPSIVFTHGITSRVLRGLWLGIGADEMSTMSGGQGCLYHLQDGRQHRYPQNRDRILATTDYPGSPA